ncbi:MAG: hypothetical protein Q9183_001739 [Haloplaca sp. 2 TL-2023]
MASPVPPPAQSVNCNDPKTGVSPACWESLAVGDYMMEWNKNNYAAVPTTCQAGEEWNVCFNRFSFARTAQKTQQNCTGIASETCTPLDLGIKYLSPQWFYGSYNSWSINKFMTGWSAALKIIAADSLSTIHKAAEPIDIDQFKVAHNGPELSIDTALKRLIRKSGDLTVLVQNDAFLKMLDQVPTNVTYDSTNIPSHEPPVANLLQERLAGVLEHVQTNVTAFVEMAKDGVFSTSNITTEWATVKALAPEVNTIVGVDNTVEGGPVEEE